MTRTYKTIRRGLEAIYGKPKGIKQRIARWRLIRFVKRVNREVGLEGYYLAHEERGATFVICDGVTVV